LILVSYKLAKTASNCEYPSCFVTNEKTNIWLTQRRDKACLTAAPQFMIMFHLTLSSWLNRLIADLGHETSTKHKRVKKQTNEQNLKGIGRCEMW